MLGDGRSCVCVCACVKGSAHGSRWPQVSGGELFDRICEKVVYTEAEARDLVRILLSTLAFLHNRQIVSVSQPWPVLSPSHACREHRPGRNLGGLVGLIDMVVTLALLALPISLCRPTATSSRRTCCSSRGRRTRTSFSRTLGLPRGAAARTSTRSAARRTTVRAGSREPPHPLFTTTCCLTQPLCPTAAVPAPPSGPRDHLTPLVRLLVRHLERWSHVGTPATPLTMAHSLFQSSVPCAGCSALSAEVSPDLPPPPPIVIHSTYILLGGYPPFQSRTDDRDELFKIIKRGKVRFHDEYWSDISDDAKDMIQSMLTVDVSQRPSANALLRCA